MPLLAILNENADLVKALQGGGQFVPPFAWEHATAGSQTACRSSGGERPRCRGRKIAQGYRATDCRLRGARNPCAYDEKTETWFFLGRRHRSGADAAARERLRKEGNESVTKCHRLNCLPPTLKERFHAELAERRRFDPPRLRVISFRTEALIDRRPPTRSRTPARFPPRTLRLSVPADRPQERKWL